MTLPPLVPNMFIAMSVVWFFTCALPAISVSYHNIYEWIRVFGKNRSPSLREEPLSTKEKMKSIIWTWLSLVLLPTVITYLYEMNYF